MLLPVLLTLWLATINPCLSQRLPKTHIQSESVCYGVTPPFSWVLVCTRFCLCPHIVSASLVLWKFCNPALLIFNIWFPGDSKSLCYNSRLRNVLWDLEPLKQCRNFFDIIVLQFVDHLPNGSMVGLMTNSTKRTFATCHASKDWWFQCRCPHNKPLLTHASTEDPQTFTGSSESVSCWGGGSLLFSWVLVHTSFISNVC